MEGEREKGSKLGGGAIGIGLWLVTGKRGSVVWACKESSDLIIQCLARWKYAHGLNACTFPQSPECKADQGLGAASLLGNLRRTDTETSKTVSQCVSVPQ